ncbi:MAG: hypothetical protein HKN81_05480 [Gammaproteobacteria bacterium]|nr:hypothetical protein [Gammaproteobacteria bacterium]
MSAFIESGAWIALLGWPSLFGGALAFAFAIARKSRRWAIVGCVLAAPTFLYLALTPRFGWIAAAAFALLCVLVWRIRDAGRLATSALVIPAASLLLWLAYAVVTQ